MNKPKNKQIILEEKINTLLTEMCSANLEIYLQQSAHQELCIPHFSLILSFSLPLSLFLSLLIVLRFGRNSFVRFGKDTHTYRNENQNVDKLKNTTSVKMDK